MGKKNLAFWGEELGEDNNGPFCLFVYFCFLFCFVSSFFWGGEQNDAE